jgi:farnesyl diphosphate synthase
VENEHYLNEAMATTAAAVDRKLDKFLALSGGAERKLVDAIRYSMFGGGKRLRPFLVVSGANLFEVDMECSLRVAAAVECIHCYSLIHDDLPAMDDDDQRRGQPTVHKKFDEATAILAGDALQALAFEILSDERTHSDPRVRGELVVGLARAIGLRGMVGGQMIDLEADKYDLDEGEITRLQNMKTGALICFSAEAGAILAKASNHQRNMLLAYGRDLGLAFQIADDLLDAGGDPDEMGKAVNKDVGRGKATFVSLLGVERARQQAVALTRQAASCLDEFGDKAILLKGLAQYVVSRRS